MNLEKIVLFETMLDHLTGEELGNALNMLNAMSEVLDALWLSGIGKKNRPAGLLQVMCYPDSEIAVRDAIFRHTHALGLRRQIVERYTLERERVTLSLGNEQIPAKAHELGGTIYARPEADALAALAARHGVGVPALRFRHLKN